MSRNYTKLPAVALTPIGVVHQQPSDLVLALLGTTLPVPVTILAQDSLRLGGYRFVFNIIGESHLTSVERDGATIFRELLACVPLPPDACQLHHPFGDLQAFSTSNGRYTGAVHFVSLPASADALAAYLHAQPAASLEVAFPPIYHCTPVTRIWWHHVRGSVHWRTLHIYPSTDRITAVWSVSSFSTEDCV